MKNRATQSVLAFLFIALFLTGCETICPVEAFQVSQDSLQVRQLQSRQYETSDEKSVIASAAGALQDMGFTLDESETPLGVIVASKDRDATNGGQVFAATFVTLLTGSGDSFNHLDKTQKIRASVVTRKNEEGNKTIVRVTFQRIIWDTSGVLSKLETLNEPGLYSGFFEKLSKAIFLQEQNI